MKKSALALLGLLVVMSATACKKEEPIETRIAVETEIETTAEKTTVAETEESTAVEIEDFQAETLEMLKSDWDACRVTQQEVEEVYFADDLMLSEAGKEEMRQYMKDHPQVVETQAPVKETKPVETKPVETKPVETQAPVEETKPVETQAPVETQSSTQNSHNPADYGMTAEEMEQLGLEFADDAFSSLHDEEGVAKGSVTRDEQIDWIK